MFKLSCIAVAALAVFCAPLHTAQLPQPVRSPDLPPGVMQAKARAACLECHDARIIIQQRLSKNAWANEVDKMVRRGTLLDTKDRESLIDYLVSNFPPDRPAEPERRVKKMGRQSVN